MTRKPPTLTPADQIDRHPDPEVIMAMLQQEFDDQAALDAVTATAATTTDSETLAANAAAVFDRVLSTSSGPDHAHGLDAALSDQIETDIADQHDAFGINADDWPQNDPTPATATEAMIYTKELDAIQRRARTSAQDKTNNPYLIESSTVLGDLAHEAHRARLAINALDNEIEHLNEDADYQVKRITARRDIEVEQREKRKNDLMKIVAADSIVNGATSGGGQ